MPQWARRLFYGSGGRVIIVRPSGRYPRGEHSTSTARTTPSIRQTWVAFLEHLLREVPGRIRIIWDGSPIHRGRVIKEFLAHGAAPRLHLERLPAYAPELNPDEGMWQRLKGVELRNLCCFNLRHLRTELQNAVKRVRRKPRIIQGCFAGTRL
jgi:transposase